MAQARTFFSFKGVRVGHMSFSLNSLKEVIYGIR